jgi:hypothetical protein
MASKKQHATIAFQGAAKITVGGAAGSSGQVLASGGSGAMTWENVAAIDDSSALTTDAWSASKIISYLAAFYVTKTSAVTKKVYDIVWDSESGYSSAGVTWESGDAAGVVTITHSLGTQGVIVSVKDIHANVTDNVHEQIDLNYPSACVVKLHSNDVIKLIFGTEPDQNNEFYVTIIG